MIQRHRARDLVRRLWNPEGTLSQRVVTGGFWVFALRISDRLFRFARTVVLARVLAPSDFGLLGIALLAMSTLETISQTGFQTALIQKKEDAEAYLDTAWTVAALRGLVLFGILCLGAHPIALFFNSSRAAPIVRAIGLSTLLRGLSNVGVVYFQKELEFDKSFLYQLSGTIADLFVSIAGALILRNVWALVLGLLAGNLVRLVMSYGIHGYRPRLRLETGRIRDLFSYGRWILLSDVLTLIGARGDDAVVGRVLGASALGLYQMAYRISQLAVTEITYVVSQTAFPAYSKLQDQPRGLRKGYFRIASFSATLSVPTAVTIAMLAPDFTRVFLGDQWLSMAPVLPVLAAAALVKSIVSTGSPVFLGSGSPQSEFQMQLARALTVAVLILPLSVTWGMSGAGFTVVVSGLSMLAVWYPRIKDQLQLAPRDLVGVFGPPVFSSLAMAGAIRLFRFLTKPLFQRLPGMQLAWFLLAVVLAVSVYVAAISLCQRVFPEHQGLREVMRVIKG